MTNIDLAQIGQRLGCEFQLSAEDLGGLLGARQIAGIERDSAAIVQPTGPESFNPRARVSATLASPDVERGSVVSIHALV